MVESSTSDSISKNEEDSSTPGPPEQRCLETTSIFTKTCCNVATKVLDRAAIMVIGETICRFGQEIQPLDLNQSNIRQQQHFHYKYTLKINQGVLQKYEIIFHGKNYQMLNIISIYIRL